MPWKRLRRQEHKPGAQLWCSDSRLWRILDVWLVLCKQTFSTGSALKPYKKRFCLRKSVWMSQIMETEHQRILSLSNFVYNLSIDLLLNFYNVWEFWEKKKKKGKCWTWVRWTTQDMLRYDKMTTCFSTLALKICARWINQYHWSKVKTFNNVSVTWGSPILSLSLLVFISFSRHVALSFQGQGGCFPLSMF